MQYYWQLLDSDPQLAEKITEPPLFWLMLTRPKYELELPVLYSTYIYSISIAASLVSGQETEIRTLQRKLARRDNEILRQERELYKLRVSDHHAETFEELNEFMKWFISE